MGKTFSIADAFQNVPNPGTDREQITYIAADLLVSDEQNFYSMDNLDELAANIQLVGLQQPIRVRPDGTGKYIIVSGHRRRAAIEQLREEEPERWAEIPCIIEDRQESDAMRKLRLIFANAATRKMTNYDLQQQAKEVEMLLYQLKEEGVEFPGRMRDHVAEACKASKSKLSRLKVIDEHLTKLTAVQKAWQKGHLPESVAYALAKLPEDVQDKIVKAELKGERRLDCLMEWRVEGLSVRLKRLNTLKCRTCGNLCIENFPQKIEKLIDNCVNYASNNCDDYCCAACPRFTSCKNVCPMLQDELAKAKASDLAEKKKEREKNAEINAPKLKFVKDVWGRFYAARNSAEVSIPEYKKAVGLNFYSINFEKYEEGKKLTSDSKLPYCLWPFEARGLIKAADALHCSLDYLFCRSDDPRTADQIAAEAQPIGQTMISGWMPGGTNPGHSCQCVVDFDLDGGCDPHRMLANWNAILGRWEFSRSGPSIDMEPIRWMELPEVE